MFNGSNCDRKSQLSGILAEPLNPRGLLPILPVFPIQVDPPNLESPNQAKNISVVVPCSPIKIRGKGFKS